jgi:hypothetical protein
MVQKPAGQRSGSSCGGCLRCRETSLITAILVFHGFTLARGGIADTVVDQGLQGISIDGSFS